MGQIKDKRLFIPSSNKLFLTVKIVGSSSTYFCVIKGVYNQILCHIEFYTQICLVAGCTCQCGTDSSI